MHTRTTNITLGALALAALAGCSGGGENEPQPIQNRLTLESFKSCEELESYIEDVAVRDMRQQLEMQKHQGWGVRGGIDTAAEGAPQADAGGKSAGPSAYTKTNTQVAGVDEADFMKNDGTRILVLSGQTLYISRSWPADKMSLQSKLTIEGYPSQMFLDENNRVVVFSSIYERYRDDEPQPGRGGADIACDGGWGCGYYHTNSTKITVINISDITRPVVQSEIYFPGAYANSRRIGSSVRVVLSDHFRWPAKVRFYPEYVPGLYEDKARLAAALDALMVENERIIRAQNLPYWFPSGRVRTAGRAEQPLAYECSDFSRANAPVHLGLLTIATVNLDQPTARPSRTSIVGQAGEIYASMDSLYVTNQHWWWWPRPGQTDHTYIHKFDITNANKAVYVASGGVAGHILNQFSMDEHRGFLRVATTINTRVPDLKNPQNTWGEIETTNRVSVMGERNGRLEVIGQTEDLAKGERIYSSRFIGDRGFVVTFRQVDPLFTFDLSNPAQPRKIGELKVPGFSTYIHPIGENHLLTMGVYLPEPDAMGRVDWRERRMKLTIFNVEDFANPKEQWTREVGTAYGWSEAAYEHKAFNYFPEKKLLAIPFSDYQPARDGIEYWSNFVSDLRVFSISIETGITPKGAITMKDVFMQQNDYGWTWYWSPWIRRSVMADDFVYAVSDGGIRSAHISALGTPLSTVTFNKAGKQ